MARKLRKLSAQGYLIYIVSNQGGIQKGFVTCETADAALRYTMQKVREDGGVVHGYDFAENDDEFRKPKTGMPMALEQALKDRFGKDAAIDKKASFMVGDAAYTKDDTTPAGKPGTHFSNTDRLLAVNYGIPFQEASVFFGWRNFGIDVFFTEAEVNNFIEFCKGNAQCRRAYPEATAGSH
jgi:DNA 3'-phosphatase